MFVLYIRWLYIIIIHGYLTWILKFLSSLLDLQKKREKNNKKKITYTHDVQSKHTRNEHLRKIQEKNQTTFVVFVCDGHSELSLPPISNCLSILQNIFFYCARVSKLLLTHSRCWNITHTHTDTLTLMMAFNSFSLTVLQTICIVLQKKHTSHPPHFYVIVRLIPSNHTHSWGVNDK